MSTMFVEGGWVNFGDGCEWGEVYNKNHTRVGKFNKVSGALFNYSGTINEAAVMFPPSENQKVSILEKYLAKDNVKYAREDLG